MTLYTPLTDEQLRASPLPIMPCASSPLLLAVINQSTPGTTVLAAGQSGKKIKVFSYVFTLSADGTAKFAGGSDLTGAMDIGAKGGMAVTGSCGMHLIETGVGVALSIITTGGAAKGHLAYVVEA